MRAPPEAATSPLGEGSSQEQAAARAPPAHGHVARFYGEDGFPAAEVALFLFGALNAGGGALTVARSARLRRVRRALRGLGLDPGQLTASGALVELDAVKLLDEVARPGGGLDLALVEARIAPLLERLRGDGRKVRAHGELVDLLCRRGEPEAALALEQVWNRLLQRGGFQLLCTYGLEAFDSLGGAGHFEQVCAAHDGLGRSGVARRARPGSLGRARLELEQKARALRAEGARRVELEGERLAFVEAALREQRRAEEASRARDELLAMLSHELRNPLSPMVTALELMRLRGEGGSAREVLERQVRHLTRLVDELLDASRFTRGKLEVRRAPVELAPVVAAAVETASPLLEQAGHALLVQVEEGLHLEGDAERLTQALENLLANAAKYTPRGGHVALRARAAGDLVRVEVIDDGVGLDAVLLPRVFDPYVQGRRTLDRAEGGLGLGLALVRSVAELHGGRVTCWSDGPGRGSTFTLELPRGRAKAGSAAAEEERPVGGGSRRILVVDDNRDAADGLGELLRRAGYEVAVAHDVHRALGAAALLRPEVAVLDIGLPLMSGWELARALRDQGQGPLAVVAVTGYGLDLDRARSAEAGFTAHLVKPVDPERLLRTLRESLAALDAGALAAG